MWTNNCRWNSVDDERLHKSPIARFSWSASWNLCIYARFVLVTTWQTSVATGYISEECLALLAGLEWHCWGRTLTMVTYTGFSVHSSAKHNFGESVKEKVVTWVGSRVGKAQTCIIAIGSIQYNLHLKRYVIERPGIKTGFIDILINSNQSKWFDRVMHRYLEATLKAVDFRPVCRGWIPATPSNTCLVIKIFGNLSEQFCIACSVRQGFSLSPLLYVLVFESLLQNWSSYGTFLSNWETAESVSVRE